MGNENLIQNQPYRTFVVNPIKSIYVDTIRDDFFKNDFVEGSVKLITNTQAVLSDILLNFHLIESWTVQETSSNSQGDINSLLLTTVRIGIGKFLKINSDLINLSQGTFCFPFKFQLPDYLQPSFEYPMQNRRGFLRYSIEAKIESPYVSGCTSKNIIIKSRPRVLNTPLFYTTISNVHKWGIIDKGSTSLKVSYPTNNYKIDQLVPITVEINNTRGSLNVTSCKCDVIRKILYCKKTTGIVQYPLEKTIVTQTFNSPVEANKQLSFTFSIGLKDKDIKYFNYFNVINPYPFLDDISFVMPSVDGGIIKCEYRLEVSLYYNSHVSNGYRPKLSLPLSITHQTQDELNSINQIKKEEDDLQKAIEISKKEEEERQQNIKNMSYLENYSKDILIENNDNRMYQSEIINNVNRQGYNQSNFNNDNELPPRDLVENNKYENVKDRITNDRNDEEELNNPYIKNPEILNNNANMSTYLRYNPKNENVNNAFAYQSASNFSNNIMQNNTNQIQGNNNNGNNNQNDQTKSENTKKLVYDINEI